jgi:hypothetical protein
MRDGAARRASHRTKTRAKSPSLRFSTRTLLLVVTLFAVLFGLWKSCIEPFRTQQRAIEALSQMGARMTIKPVGPEWLRALVGAEFLVEVESVELAAPIDLASSRPLEPVGEHLGKLRGVRSLRISNRVVSDRSLFGVEHLGDLEQLSLAFTGVSDRGVAQLGSLTKLRILDLGMTHAGGAGMARLDQLTELEQLRLNFTSVGDHGLQVVKAFAKLEVVDLGDTDVGDAAMEYLAGLRELRELNLSGTKVTDAGLVHLRGLPMLTELNLSRTSIKGEGLLHLRDLPKLRELQLVNTLVSEESLAFARESLPNVRIIRSPVFDSVGPRARGTPAPRH